MYKDRGDRKLEPGGFWIEGYKRLWRRSVDRTETGRLGEPKIAYHLASVLCGVLRRAWTGVAKPARDVFFWRYIVGRRRWRLLSPS
jgi:hypothetical protein